MELASYLEETGTTAAALARDAGCSRSYLTHVVAKRKALSRSVAIAIWRSHNVKLGPIANATDAEIEILDRFGRVAAQDAA